MEVIAVNEQEIKVLQRKIGKVTKEIADESVAEKIDKIIKKAQIDSDVFGKLLFPICANCNIYAMQYMLSKDHVINNAGELIEHTVLFRNYSEEWELKQVKILEMLFKYIDSKDQIQAANNALANAVWFGEYYAVKYLVEKQNADIHYEHNGKSLVELSENAVQKFGDTRVKEYLLDSETKSDKTDSHGLIRSFFKKIIKRQ